MNKKVLFLMASSVLLLSACRTVNVSPTPVQPADTPSGQNNPGENPGGQDNPGGNPGESDNPGGNPGGQDNPGGGSQQEEQEDLNVATEFGLLTTDSKGKYGRKSISLAVEDLFENLKYSKGFKVDTTYKNANYSAKTVPNSTNQGFDLNLALSGYSTDLEGGLSGFSFAKNYETKTSDLVGFANVNSLTGDLDINYNIRQDLYGKYFTNKTNKEVDHHHILSTGANLKAYLKNDVVYASFADQKAIDILEDLKGLPVIGSKADETLDNLISKTSAAFINLYEPTSVNLYNDFYVNFDEIITSTTVYSMLDALAKSGESQKKDILDTLEKGNIKFYSYPQKSDKLLAVDFKINDKETFNEVGQLINSAVQDNILPDLNDLPLEFTTTILEGKLLFEKGGQLTIDFNYNFEANYHNEIDMSKVGLDNFNIDLEFKAKADTSLKIALDSKADYSTKLPSQELLDKYYQIDVQQVIEELKEIEQ